VVHALQRQWIQRPGDSFDIRRVWDKMKHQTKSFIFYDSTTNHIIKVELINSILLIFAEHRINNSSVINVLFLSLCPPITDRWGRGIMFSGCLSLSVSVCVRASVRALLACYLSNQWTEFHQNLVDDVVEATDELIRF